MIDFTKLTGIEHDGKGVTQIEDSSGRVLWSVRGTKVVLAVRKTMYTTYAGETEREGEVFVAIDIYPNPYGVVKVTYNGHTKTISDITGVSKPNAQTVYFGTLYGESDGVEILESATLTIEGGFNQFGSGSYTKKSKYEGLTDMGYCGCIVSVIEWGSVDSIPDNGFRGAVFDTTMLPEGIRKIGASAFYQTISDTSIVVPEGVEEIGDGAFEEAKNMTYFSLPSTLKKIGSSVAFCSVDYSVVLTVNVLATTPPEYTGTNEAMMLLYSGASGNNIITVPKGCLDAYKVAPGWSYYAIRNENVKVTMKEVGT